MAAGGGAGGDHHSSSDKVRLRGPKKAATELEGLEGPPSLSLSVAEAVAVVVAAAGADESGGIFGVASPTARGAARGRGSGTFW